jgi:Arc/MetJ-type ribon-helix-helix transcriptional regulator
MDKKGEEEGKPFKNMRITLSDDAVVMLEGLKKNGRFRSYSATIEEAIRTLHELSIEDITFRYQLGKIKNDPESVQGLLAEFGNSTFKRLSRFLGLKRDEILRRESE